MKQPATQLARNLQTLREARSLSLTELSQLCGVSKSMLWQIEAGQSSPTIATLWKIANGLRVPFTAFLNERSSEATLGAFRDNEPLGTETEGYRLYPLVLFDPARSFEVYYMEIDPGTTFDGEPHEGDAEEYVFVVRGKIDVTVEGQRHSADTEQFICFAANGLHRYHNPGDETAATIMLISYRA
jgi:transcriptional regulator with XRE-family HTH domain